MNVNEMLEQAGFHLETTKTEKWRPILDSRPEFQTRFHTRGRLGKLQNGCLYFTVKDLDLTARNLMNKHGLAVLELGSTSGKSERIYPGFDAAKCSDASIAGFIAELSQAVNSLL